MRDGDATPMARGVSTRIAELAGVTPLQQRDGIRHVRFQRFDEPLTPGHDTRN